MPISVRGHLRSGRPVRPHWRYLKMIVGNGLISMHDMAPNHQIGNRVGEVWFGSMARSPGSVGGDFMISSAYVDDAFRRSGIARRLVRAAEAEMRAQGAKTIYLSDVQPSAWDFWTMMGYHRAPFVTAEMIREDGDTWVKRRAEG